MKSFVRQGQSLAGTIWSWRRRLLDVGAIILIGAACFFFFAEPIFTSKCFFPWDMLGYFSLQRFVSDAMHMGILPLWDPYLLSGFPIVADVQASMFYPPTLLSFFAPGAFPLRLRVVETVWVLHVFVAGAGTYLLGRKLALDRIGSLVGATVFMFGGFFPMHAEHEDWVKTTALIPVVFLLYFQALRSRKIALLLGAGLAFGISVLAGYTATSIYTAYLLLFLCLYQSATHVRTKRYRQILKNLVSLGLVLFIGLGISAVQVLPAYEYLASTTRGEQDYSQSIAPGVTPVNMLTMLLPGIFGMSKSLAPGSPYLGGDPTVTQLYFGLPALALVLVGLTSKNRYKGFFLSLSVLSIFLACGSLVPVYKTYASALPLLKLFRRPQAFYPFFVLAAAMLGGMGATTLSEGDRKQGIKGAVIGVSILAGVCLAIACAVEYLRFLTDVSEVSWLSKLMPPLGYLSVAAIDSLIVLGATAVLLLAMIKADDRTLSCLQVLLVLLVFLDLYYANGNQIYNCAPGNPNTIVHERGAHGQVLPGIDLMRDDHMLGQYRVAIGPYGGAWNNASNVIRMESINGYNPLVLGTYAEFISAVDDTDSPLLDLLNVKYIVTNQGYLTHDWDSDADDRAQLLHGGRVSLMVGATDSDKLSLIDSTSHGWLQLYERPSVLARSFGVNHCEVITDRDQRLAALQDPAFDPSKVVILEKPIDEELTGNLTAVSLSCYEPNVYRLVARVNGGGIILVMSEVFYPGWRAYVDGTEREILRVDHTFRGLYLEDGVHDVIVVYDPVSFRVGLLITVATVAAVLLVLACLSLARIGRRALYPMMAVSIVAPVFVGGWLFSLSGYDCHGCKVREPAITYPVQADLGGKVALLGYDVFPQNGIVEPGEALAISIYWQAQREIEEDYTVFVHLVDGANHRWAQGDNWPTYWTRPTSGWAKGEMVRDGHALELPSDIPAGKYRLLVGMYVPLTMDRLPTLDANGKPYGDGTVTLDTAITIVRPPSQR